MQLMNMNNISEYIIEKLKLNKDIGKDSLPKKGDLVLSVKHFDYHKQFDISLTYYIVISCDGTTLKCRQDGGVMVKKYKLFDLENRSYKGRFDVFAYADDLTDNNTFEFIIADYDKIMKCLEECKKKGGLEINGYIYDNVVYYDEYQYTSKELIDIFNEEPVTEKLHLDKETLSKNHLLNKFTNDISALCGIDIDYDKQEIYIKEIDNQLYINNINEKNIDIYCDSKFDLLNRYHDIKYNSDSNKFVDLIKFNPSIFGNIDFDNNNLTLSNYPFKIWSCKDGFVIMYQKFNENYKIYITKKYEESK